MRIKKILLLIFISLALIILIPLVHFYRIYFDIHQPSTNFRFAEKITIRNGDDNYSTEDKKEMQEILFTLEGRYSFVAAGGCPSSNVDITIYGNNKRARLRMAGDDCGFYTDLESIKTQSLFAYLALRNDNSGRSKVLVAEGGNRAFRKYMNQHIFPV